MKQAVLTRLLLLSTVGFTALLSVSPAQAGGLDSSSEICRSNGKLCYNNVLNTLTIKQGAAAGTRLRILFNKGYVNGQLIQGLTSRAVLTLLKPFDSTMAEFRISVANTSCLKIYTSNGRLVPNGGSDPNSNITTSRLSVIGFDSSLPINSQESFVTSNFTDGSPNDPNNLFLKISSSQSRNSSFIDNLDFCANSAGGSGNCIDGTNNGVLNGTIPLIFDSTLKFNTSGDVTFSNFYSRYRAIEGASDTSGSGVGQVPTPAFFLGVISLGAVALRKKKQCAQASEQV